MLTLFTGAASAGAFVIDTAGITGTVNQKITVPVIVQNAENICGFQITVKGNQDAADIVFNRTSVSKGFTYDDTTGIIIWTGYSQNPFQSLSGNTEVFSLDITPKKSGELTISVEVTDTQAGSTLASATPVAPYQGSSVILSVSGSSQTPVNPPVNPEIPTENPTISPETPTEDPTISPETPETPGEIEPVPSIPEIPQIPDEQPASPMPLAGVFAGLTAAVLLCRKFI